MNVPGYGEWTGPRPGDCQPGTRDQLLVPIPGDRWPYGPPPYHQPGCRLHEGGLYCDCAASCADDVEWGMGV